MLDGLIDGTQNIRGFSMPLRNHGSSETSVPV